MANHAKALRKSSGAEYSCILFSLLLRVGSEPSASEPALHTLLAHLRPHAEALAFLEFVRSTTVGSKAFGSATVAGPAQLVVAYATDTDLALPQPLSLASFNVLTHSLHLSRPRHSGQFDCVVCAKGKHAKKEVKRLEALTKPLDAEQKAALQKAKKLVDKYTFHLAVLKSQIGAFAAMKTLSPGRRSCWLTSPLTTFSPTSPTQKNRRCRRLCWWWSAWTAASVLGHSGARRQHTAARQLLRSRGAEAFAVARLWSVRLESRLQPWALDTCAAQFRSRFVLSQLGGSRDGLAFFCACCCAQNIMVTACATRTWPRRAMASVSICFNSKACAYTIQTTQLCVCRL